MKTQPDRPLPNATSPETPLNPETLLTIVALFRTGLGRTPEPAEMQPIAAKIRAGAPYSAIAQHIANTAEFRAIHGNHGRCDTPCATLLLRNGFARDPAEHEIAALTAHESAATALAAIAADEQTHATIDLFTQTYPKSATPQDDAAYRLWLQKYHTPSAQDRLAIQHHIDSMTHHPRFSLILPTSTTTLDRAATTLASLERQLWQNWELVLVCSAEPDDATLAPLRSLAAREPRIRLIFSTATPGSEVAIHQGYTASQGDYVGFLEPGDQLSETALYEFAAIPNTAETPILLYCDEGRIDTNGLHCAVQFKTGWSSDLILSGDFVGQLALLQRSRLEEIDWIPCEGSFSRFRLMLRTTHGLNERFVRHVPVIGFHRHQPAHRPVPSAQCPVPSAQCPVPSANTARPPNTPQPHAPPDRAEPSCRNAQ